MFSPKNDASSGFVTLSETNIDEGGKASPSKGASVPKTGESSSLLSRSDLEAQSVATGSKIVVPWWKNRIYIGAAAVIGVAVLTISLIVVYEQDSGRNARHTTILISFDGIRHDYLERGLSLPAFQRVQLSGVTAQWMQPIFPSETFPNHYTIVTGLYAESHGIVANSMYDDVFNATFTMSNGGSSDGRWWGGDPIWNTIQRQGKRAFVMFWPGSEAEINGQRPDKWFPYDGAYLYTDRVQTVLDWLDMPDSEGPDLILTYFEDVDHAGHSYGPYSPEVDAAMVEVDYYLGLILDGIHSRGLENRTNLLLVSDHGMAPVDGAHVIFLDDYIPDMSMVNVVDWSPDASIFPIAPWTAQDVFDALSGKHPNLTVYRKENIPAQYVYDSNRRIPPVLADADEGWTIYPFRSSFRNYTGTRGTHGYDNFIPDMQAIFLATGPAFVDNTVHAPIQNRDVYPLLCHLLNVTASPNNGSFDEVADMLV